MEPRAVRFDDLPGLELAPGATARSLFGQNLQLNVVDLEPGAFVGLHSHPHEQCAYVMRGELILEVAGVEHRLGPNEAVLIPGGAEHSALGGPDGALVVDVFSPVREDQRARVDAGD